MKRSFCNSVIKETIEFLEVHHFKLPEWAYWSFDAWKQQAQECAYIFDASLGWDVTDSGGDFATQGLTLFTIRNGIVGDAFHPYCEKIIVMKPGQVCPYHFHKRKVEDIINRSGGALAFRFATATSSHTLSEDKLDVFIDGIRRTVQAQEEIVLHNGQSITIEPQCYHSFYPLEAPVLIGEVSTVSDDNNDNFFLEAVARFPKIEEDEAIHYPLVNDYALLRS